MKLVNQTSYDTRTLRSLICRVHVLLAKSEGRLKTWAHLTVTVVYAHRRYMSGNASLSGYRMRLRMPKQHEHADPAYFAWLVEHELLHNYGYRHKQMERGWPTAEQLTARFGWAREKFGAALPVFVPPPKRAKPDVQERRYTRVLASIKRWTTKLKRAQTALKTLGARRRYYERAFAQKKGGDTHVGDPPTE